MTKRHRGQQSTKKREDPSQLSPQQQTNRTSNKAAKYDYSAARKVFSRGVTIISILLNFWLAYLALYPKVTVDYASHLIPDNPIALPIKVSNIGLLPIYEVECFLEDNDIKTINNSLSTGSISQKLITQKLVPNKPAEFVHSPVDFNDKPVRGNVKVTLKYRLPIIHKTITSEPDIFSIYKSKDGFIRWIHQ